MYEKLRKWTEILNNKGLIFVVAVIVVAPLFINVGLMITDYIYVKTGLTLTAQGLSNVEWLDFWKQYLAIAISFVGVCLVYISSNMDRKQRLREDNARQYLEEVRREEDVLVEVTQSFNTGVIYEAILQQAKDGIYAGKKVLADSRASLNKAHIQFEILTELCDDFKKCEKCDYAPCVDKKVMTDLRDLFYDMEKHYFAMLKYGEEFFDLRNQEEMRIKLLKTNGEMQKNLEQIITLYEFQGLTENADVSREELQTVKETISNLEKSQLEQEKIDKIITQIEEEINCINKEMRPKFVGCCKVYIDMKKARAKELRATGHIQYRKVEEK